MRYLIERILKLTLPQILFWLLLHSVSKRLSHFLDSPHIIHTPARIDYEFRWPFKNFRK